MPILKETHPIAKKTHHCMFCNGVIEQGQRYFRQTSVYEGCYIGDFVCHDECNAISTELAMYRDCDPEYGLNADVFCEYIDAYIDEHHHDDETDDIQADWQGLTKYQEVCKILNELKTVRNYGNITTIRI